MISNEEIQIRKQKAIDTFTKTFGWTYQKLGSGDVDYKILKDGQLLAYCEIIPRYKNISVAYPLPIQGTRLMKLASKILNPISIWACDDGIIYSKIKVVEGQIRWGSLLPHLNVAEHGELMCYYAKQKRFKYIKYT